MDPRDNLIQLVDRQIQRDNLNAVPGIRPVVTLEEFFTGNNDFGSIGCNLNENPGPPAFFQALKELRGRADVKTVLVGITEVDERSGGSWPFSDEVYVVTTAPAEVIKSAVESLQPDEVFPITKDRANIPAVSSPFTTLVIWWD